MDPPSPISAVPTTAEPENNNTHVAANPTQTPALVINHPPYADMIYGAITALKERDGSSRRAIAKYIEQVYPSLPPTHSALLTHHLKRLKSSGHLEMVKKSYKIAGAPRSDAPPPDSAAPPPSLPSPGQPRGRGRPPKPKPDRQQLVIPQQPQLQHILQPPIPIPQQPISIPIPQPPISISQPPFSISQQPISIPMPIPVPQQPIPIPQQYPILNFQSFPQPSLLPQPPPPPQPQQQQSFHEPNVQQQQPNSELMVVDVPKKRPGRPRKDPAAAAIVVGQNSPVVAKRGRGRPPGSRMSKKRPGRPPKPKTVSSVSGPNGIVKRRPGRPSKAEPRTVFIPYATNVPIGAFEHSNGPGAIVPQPAPRPRGRPKKDKSAAASSGVAATGSGRPRGRPPLLPGAERPKLSRSGRPVGRPKKDASLAITVAPDPNLAANVELKRKLEYFQSKVGEAVGVLKPYLNNESAVGAAAAIQELEGLATMDISAPLIIATQQPAPQS